MIAIRTIAGVDPGLATMGLTHVARGRERVLDALTLRERKRRSHQGEGDPAFTEAWERADRITTLAAATLQDWQPDLIVVESYIDQASRRARARRTGRQDRNSWQAPLAIGALMSKLEAAGLAWRVIFQNPAALSADEAKAEIAKLEAARRADPRPSGVIVDGDEALDSEHTVSAFMHASLADTRAALYAEELALRL